MNQGIGCGRGVRERSTGVRHGQRQGLSADTAEGGLWALPGLTDLPVCAVLRNLNSLLSGKW